MEKLTCDLCGSKEFTEVDGYYVCIVCGMKYKIGSQMAQPTISKTEVQTKEPTIEKTRVSKPSSVNGNVEQYNKLALEALNNKDSNKVYEYCEEAHKIDNSNSQAWYLEATGINFNNTWNKNNIDLSIKAAVNAVNFYDGNERSSYAEALYNSIKQAIYHLRNSANSYDNKVACAYINHAMEMLLSALTQIPFLSETFLKEEVVRIKKECEESQNSILPRNRLLYDAYCVLNNNIDYGTYIEEQLKKNGLLI